MEVSYWDQDSLCQFRYETHLASIHSTSQDADAHSICNESTICWIGLNDNAIANVFEWTDASAFDYGTDTSGGVAPWKTDEPNDFGSDSNDEACVTIEYGWNDGPCENEHEALCNYPETNFVFNDPTYYERIPSGSQIIGTMDALDEVEVEFDLTINTFSGGYSNILGVEGDGLRLLEIGMQGSKIYFSRYHVDQQDNPTLSGTST